MEDNSQPNATNVQWQKPKIQKVRADGQSRDFKCQVCERTYLSYPAMYTHMKNKHALDPNGTAFNSNARSRGRPKTTTDGQRIDPTSDLYMKQDGRFGEQPICPTSNFDEVCAMVFSYDSKYKGDALKHPLREALFKFSHEETPGIPTDADDAQGADADLHKEFRDKTSEIIQMGEEHRVMLCCDEIFAQYLRHLSSMVNDQFYKTLIRFVLLFRDCFNQFGWLKKAESECREARVTLEEKNVQSRVDAYRDQINLYEFCQVNNGELLPEICNEFVTIYLNDKKDVAGFERAEAIDYVRHFCHWLFINGHTCSKLSMIH